MIFRCCSKIALQKVKDMSLESQANQRSGPDEVVDTVCIHGEECCADWEDCGTGVFRHHLNSGDDSANGAALQESGISNDSNNTPLDGSGAKPECANGTEYGKGGLLEGRTMEGGSRTNGVAEDGVVLRECEMMEENQTCSMAKEGDRVDETCSGMSGGGAAELEGGVGSGVGTSESERKGRALMGDRVEISEGERGSEGLENATEKEGRTGGVEDGRVENNNVFGIGATGITDETSECGHTDTASGSRSLDDKQHDSADFEVWLSKLCACLVYSALLSYHPPHGGTVPLLEVMSPCLPASSECPSSWE